MEAVARPWTQRRSKHVIACVLRFAVSWTLMNACWRLKMREYEDSTEWQNLENKVVGYYVDEAIQTVRCQKSKGVNILELQAPFGRQTNLEWCYLLGDFGVRVNRFEKMLTKRTGACIRRHCSSGASILRRQYPVQADHRGQR